MTEAAGGRHVPKNQAIRLRNLSKVFPGPQPVAALHDFSLDIAQGEVAIILGPSGCGKSTAVRIIAGLTTATSGFVVVNEEPVLGPRHDCGMVFQSYTSFPWLSVIDNIAFGLRYKSKTSLAERRAIARQLACEVGLEEFQSAFISKLSGGMKQRVAIASALATNPEILLMDEPFGALDSQTRMVMQEHLLTIVERTKKTVVFVTHDIEEALLLGDRIYVCSARPARVLAELEVPFGHPRTAATRNQREFFEMKHEIFYLLREHIYDRMAETAHGQRRRRKS